VIIKDTGRTITFASLQERLYRAAVKTTKTGEALFLESFRRVDQCGAGSCEIAKKKSSEGYQK